MHLKKLFGKDANKVVALCIDMYEQRTNNTKLYSVCKFHHTRIEWCGSVRWYLCSTQKDVNP